MPSNRQKIEDKVQFRDRLKTFKIKPAIYKKFQKRLAPEEKFILRVILLRERDNLLQEAQGEGKLVSTEMYEQLDEIVVDACLKTGDWDRIVASYVRQKIQSQREKSHGASVLLHSSRSPRNGSESNLPAPPIPIAPGAAANSSSDTVAGSSSAPTGSGQP